YSAGEDQGTTVTVLLPLLPQSGSDEAATTLTVEAATGNASAVLKDTAPDAKAEALVGQSDLS
ncbi:MAG: hypothetical protein AAGF01_06940, partial [Cyanobacteria bacterium P01_G01_bin.38]